MQNTCLKENQLPSMPNPHKGMRGFQTSTSDPIAGLCPDRKPARK